MQYLVRHQMLAVANLVYQAYKIINLTQKQ